MRGVVTARVGIAGIARVARVPRRSALFRSATYALGSHAFERGALGDARDAFVEVLRRDPTDEDARYNLELVLLALQPPPPAADAGPSRGAPPARPGSGRARRDTSRFRRA